MTIFGQMMALIAAAGGCTYKSKRDNKNETMALHAAALYYGLDRPESYLDEANLKAKYEYDWETGERVLYDPDLIDFFENGNWLARSDWVDFKIKSIMRERGFKPTTVYSLDGNYERGFIERYEKDMWYWWNCRMKNIKFYDLPSKCKVCGTYMEYPDEPCPVCGGKPLVKLKTTYRQAKEGKKQQAQQQIQKQQEAAQQDSSNFKTTFIISWIIWGIIWVIMYSMLGVRSDSEVLGCILAGAFTGGGFGALTALIITKIQRSIKGRVKKIKLRKLK